MPSERQTTEVDHEHEWVKEGPAGVRGSSGTELWIVYTCAIEGCQGWKRESLYANYEVDKESKASNQGVSGRDAVLAFSIAIALVLLLFGIAYLKSTGALP